MASPQHKLSITERALKLFVPIEAGEGKPTLMLTAYAFLLLLIYYLLKPIREALLLADLSAEVRSYTIAVQALLLIFIVPAYSNILRQCGAYRMLPLVTLFVAITLLLFWLLTLFNVNIAIPYYIWLGIINVLIIAQFWAYAADIHQPGEGKRLFALIAAGASLGSLVGSQLSKQLFSVIDVDGLMLLASLMLLATLYFPIWFWRHRKLPTKSNQSHKSLQAGFDTVLSSSYLKLIAVFVILLNTINSTGEYILAKWVKEVMASSPDQVVSLGEFYGDFYSWVNLCSLLIQLFLVSRIFKWININGAIMILPIIATIGYGLAAFIPVFSLFRIIKITENSFDYSLQNTTRHALFLPLNQRQIYEGKTVIDSLCWRLGDLVHVAVVFIGFNYFDLSYSQFAAVNLVACVAWLLVASRLALFHKTMQVKPTLVKRRTSII